MVHNTSQARISEPAFEFQDNYLRQSETTQSCLVINCTSINCYEFGYHLMSVSKICRCHQTHKCDFGASRPGISSTVLRPSRMSVLPLAISYHA